jgi:hypothetical protein
MLAIDFFVVPRLRINGEQHPLLLHVYMKWTGTTLLRSLHYLALPIMQYFLSCSINLFSTSPEEPL